MSAVRDILQSYRSPSAVVRRRLEYASESAALATLMAATLIIFVAQWPRLGREAFLDPSIPLEARIGGAMLGIVFFLPLTAYVLSGVLWVILRVIYGPVTGLDVRVAFFWSLLAAAPLWLAQGFFNGFLDDAPFVNIVELALLGAFVWIFLASMHAVGKKEDSQ